MSDNPKVTGDWNSASGVIRHPTEDPPKPTNLPSRKQRELRDEAGATTGMIPVVTEGMDVHAERDTDKHTDK